MPSYKQKVINHHEKYSSILVNSKEINYKKDLLSFKILALDAGCGAGTYLHKNIIGMDISKKLIKEAKKKGLVLLGDLEALPFKTESFDLVYSFSTIYYTKNFSKVVNEASFVLMPKGRFVFDHINKYNLKALYYKIRYFKVPQFFITYARLNKTLKNFKLKIKNLENGLRFLVEAQKLTEE